MKEKIIEQLKKQYANLGLGDKAFDGVAEFLKPSIEKEEDIEAAIKNVSGLLKSFQSEADTIRTAKANAEKKAAELEEQIQALKEAKKVEPVKNELPKTHQDEYEERFKTLETMFTEKLGATQAELAQYKNAEAEAKRNAFIVSKANELGIPQTRIDEGFVISVEADETAIAEHLAKVAENVVALQVQNQGKFQIPRNKELSLEDGQAILKRIQR